VDMDMLDERLNTNHVTVTPRGLMQG